MPGRARPPSSRSSAWASTVLPAPVSPVRTLRPGPRRSSARSMSRRFSTRSSLSTPDGLPAPADGPPCLRRSGAGSQRLRSTRRGRGPDGLAVLVQLAVVVDVGDVRVGAPVAVLSAVDDAALAVDAGPADDEVAVARAAEPVAARATIDGERHGTGV